MQDGAVFAVHADLARVGLHWHLHLALLGRGERSCGAVDGAFLVVDAILDVHPSRVAERGATPGVRDGEEVAHPLGDVLGRLVAGEEFEVELASLIW